MKKIEKDNKKLEGVINGRYKKISKLGDGSQATVFLVEDIKEQNKLKALKKYHPIPSDSAFILECAQKEIDILKRLSNEYLISYLDSFVTTIEDDEFKVYHIVNDLYQVTI